MQTPQDSTDNFSQFMSDLRSISGSSTQTPILDDKNKKVEKENAKETAYQGFMSDLNQQVSTQQSSQPSGEADKKISTKVPLDNSDKISRLGSLVQGGKIGLEEFLARFGELGLRAQQKLGLQPEGTADKAIAGFYQNVKDDPRYQAAQAAHPTLTSVGEFGGGMLPLMAVPEAGIGEAAAKGVGELGAKTGLSLLEKAAPVAGIGARAATVGTLLPKKPDQSTAINIAGALAGEAGSRALSKIAPKLISPIPKAIKEFAERHGISMPTYPGLDKYLTSAETRAKTLKDLAQKIYGDVKGKLIHNRFGGSLRKQLVDQYNKNWKTSLKKYGAIENEIKKQLIDKPEMENVPLTNYRTQLSNILGKSSKLPASFQDAPFLKDIQEKMGEEDQPYSVVQLMQDNLSSKAQESAPGVARQYGQLGRSLGQDLTDYIKDLGGNARKLHATADQFYKDKIVPIKYGPYKKILDRNFSSDDMIGKFLRPDKEESLSTLVSLLPSKSEKGLVAARAAILSHALKNADVGGVGFNGFKFAKEALRLGESNKVLFSKNQKEVLEGYQKLASYLSKKSPEASGVVGKVPSPLLRFGASVAGGAVGGMALLHHPTVGLAILTSGIGTAKLLTSNAGREILQKVSRLGEKYSEKQISPLLEKALRLSFTKKTADIFQS